MFQLSEGQIPMVYIEIYLLQHSILTYNIMGAAKSIKKLSDLRDVFSRFRQLTEKNRKNILPYILCWEGISVAIFILSPKITKYS